MGHTRPTRRRYSCGTHQLSVSGLPDRRIGNRILQLEIAYAGILSAEHAQQVALYRESQDLRQFGSGLVPVWYVPEDRAAQSARQEAVNERACNLRRTRYDRAQVARPRPRSKHSIARQACA